MSEDKEKTIPIPRDPDHGNFRNIPPSTRLPAPPPPPKSDK